MAGDTELSGLNATFRASIRTHILLSVSGPDLLEVTG